MVSKDNKPTVLHAQALGYVLNEIRCCRLVQCTGKQCLSVDENVIARVEFIGLYNFYDFIPGVILMLAITIL